MRLLNHSVCFYKYLHRSLLYLLDSNPPEDWEQKAKVSTQTCPQGIKSVRIEVLCRSLWQYMTAWVTHFSLLASPFFKSRGTWRKVGRWWWALTSEDLDPNVASWCWTGYGFSLSPSFLIYKMGAVLEPTTYDCWEDSLKQRMSKHFLKTRLKVTEANEVILN